jgi:ribosomal protein S5
VKATVNGLKELRTIQEVAKLRGKTVQELTGQGVKDEA